ncbi:DUF7302 family protein [Effusibacillus dendaii]|nr:hypothetical protein [Effusibacillus dendaii]
MKVKMLTSIAAEDWSYAIGETVDLDDEQAAAWIESGLAETADAEQVKKAPARKKAGDANGAEADNSTNGGTDSAE